MALGLVCEYPDADKLNDTVKELIDKLSQCQEDMPVVVYTGYGDCLEAVQAVNIIPVPKEFETREAVIITY